MSRSAQVAEAQEQEEEPRRGGRVRKQVDRFEPGSSKRKQAGDEDDEEDDEDEELSEEERPVRKSKQKKARAEVEGDDESADSGEDEPVRKKSKKRAGGAGKKTAAPKKRKAAAVTTADEPISQMKTDCALFNALISPDIALLPLVEEWVETYQQTAEDETSETASVHELIQFLIRCCGLNADVEEHETLDVDGIVDAIERIQDESMLTSIGTYPLIARTKEAKAIRTNLNLFIPHLIKTLSLTPLFYETDKTTKHSAPILSLLFNWLHSMSSSPLRPIRHTSTHLALRVCSALCDIAAGVASELSLTQRQKDAEAKKGAQGPAGKKRLAELEAKVKECKEKKKLLHNYMQETFDVMFVHRVRDADPAIRTECLRELGVWAKKYGQMYIDIQYLNYFTRGCNDPDAKARLETVKALPSLVRTEVNTTRAQGVLLRLSPRLIEMSLRDVDLNVRVHALNLIADLDQTGVFDEDTTQRSKITRLVYDSEPKVRKAVGGFFHGLWEQRVQDLKLAWNGGRKKKGKAPKDDELEIRFGYKAIAVLLLETARTLDPNGSDFAKAASRATAAVEALWDQSEGLQNWEDLAEYLLLDHSEDEAWLLEEEEETLLLSILVACIKRDDTDDDDAKEEHTKTLMTVLPKLFTKHQADSERMEGLLSVPALMKLGLYLDLRKNAAYEALWDDITKQFLQHTDSGLLTAAIKAIIHLSSESLLSSVNDTKLAELDETVFTALRDAINGEEVFSMSMDEDQLATIQAILLRISLLVKSRNIVGVMEEDEGGQSTGWEIVCAFVERGEVGYREEAKMAEYAVQIVFLHLAWIFRSFTEDDANDSEKVAKLVEKRDKAKDVFYNLALRERTNAAESVRRQAFIAYLNLHILFSSKSAKTLPAAKAAGMEIPDEDQHRLGGVYASSAERYLSDREEQGESQNDENPPLNIESANQEIVFLQLTSVFVGAIRCGVLDVEHAKEPLTHYGRIGVTFDAVARKLVDVLRDEGIYNEEATTVQHVASSALQNSFGFFIDSSEEEPAATIALSKVIASAFTVQGNHFTILKQIHPSDVADLHLSSIDYIARQIGNAVKAEKNGKSKAAKDRAQAKIAQCVTFFKALINLLGPVTGRDAVKIREHLDDVVLGSGAKVGTGKNWEGYRAYEKRLLTIANKDPEVKIVPQQTKKAAAAEGDEEGEVEETDNEDRRATPTRAGQGSRQASRADIAGEQDEEEGGSPDVGSLKRKAGVQDVEEEGSMEVDIDFDVPAPLDEEEEGLPEVDVVYDEIQVENDDEELVLDLPNSAEARARSVSVEPGVKKRKKARRF